MKRGTYLRCESGEYSDYGVQGFYVVLEDFDMKEALFRYVALAKRSGRITDKTSGDLYQALDYDEAEKKNKRLATWNKFWAHLVRQKLIAELPTISIDSDPWGNIESILAYFKEPT